MTTPHPDDLTDVPSAAEYIKAFRAARDAGALKSANARSVVFEMLLANYQAPNHTVTPGELAALTNLPSYKQANLRYGKFAKDVATRLGREPKIKVAILVRFSGGTPGKKTDQDEAIKWTLLPEVVQALSETWFAHLKPES
jgi:hypothetical protein